MFKYVSDVSILAHNIISEYVENKNVAVDNSKAVQIAQNKSG